MDFLIYHQYASVDTIKHTVFHIKKFVISVESLTRSLAEPKFLIRRCMFIVISPVIFGFTEPFGRLYIFTRKVHKGNLFK